MAEDDRDSGEQELLELVARCLDRIEEEGEGIVGEVCREHPHLAEPLRQRLRLLLDMGLLGEEESPTLPERLGEFRLIEKLGEGGMGVVYLAEQEPLGREVALKIIRPDHMYFGNTRDRFQLEVQTIARMQHPGIVPIFTVGEERGIPYFAMERIRGCSLERALSVLRGRDLAGLAGSDLASAVMAATPGADQGPRAADLFSGTYEASCLRIAARVAETLEYVHQRGVIHRDIKPSNIMLTPSGGVMILDFGLASAEEKGERLTRSGARLGSLPYMAPEQVRGERAGAGPFSDVYSLGVTLYEMLTLRAAFGGPSTVQVIQAILDGEKSSPRTVNPSLSWEAETVCLTAMDVDEDRRYRRAADLALDLDNVLHQRMITARRASFARRARRWIQRHPASAVAAALAVVLVVGGPLTFGLQERSAAKKIERESKDAERSRLATLRAVDSLLTRVATSRIIEVPESTELRRELLQDAYGILEDLLATREGDRHLRLAVASAQGRVAELHKHLDEFDEAEAALLGCIERYESVLTDHPGDSVAMYGRADARVVLANLQYRRGNMAESERLLLAAREDLDQVGPDVPNPTAVHQLLAECHDNLAILQLGRGEREEGEASCRLAIEILSELAAANPDNSQVGGRLINALNNLGGLEASTGRIDEGLARHRESIDIATRLHERAPESVNERKWLAHSEGMMGFALGEKGEFDEAVIHAERGVAAWRALAENFPAVPEMSFSLANALFIRWRIEMLAERPERGDAAVNEAATILRRLCASHPGVAQYRSLLSAVEPFVRDE